jgi:hypothetical protein
MSVESRVEYLLRAADRAEREGNERLAAILREMASELRPADEEISGADLHFSLP